ncbi:MAG: DNA polymerase/3'-5' exonuclease PolX [Chloroflexi bacterium]|nr:DNA polymerase/3'-5' exonuclease PolX [Chloroflexota bacterium]
MPSNLELAALFREIANLLEIKGEVVYKYLAYREAARQIENYPHGVEALARAGRTREVPGVGDAIARKIEELVATGRMEFLERTRAEVPTTLADLLQIPGLGAKKIQTLHRSLGVSSMDDLRAALAAGQIRALPGMGARTEERLAVEVERWRERGRRIPIGAARAVADDAVAHLRSAFPDLTAIEAAGSLRRWRDTIGDIDIVVGAADAPPLIAAFIAMPGVRDVLGAGDTRASIVSTASVQIDLRVVPRQAFGAAMQYFTGSKAHNVRLRALAQRMGLTLNEYALSEEATGRVVASATEEEIYAALGLPWIPPELREDLGEFEAGQAGTLPRLIEAADLIGELHAHTDWSDGHLTLEGVAHLAATHGRRYLAITDHSIGLAMARGLDADRARAQWEQIDAWNARGEPPWLLKGVELEILADGTLDLDPETLAGFDIVVASVHSMLRQDRGEMTSRLVRAVSHPRVDVLGHATGRILGRRDAYEVDMEAVLAVAAAHGVAVEINASPDRLDLDDALARQARAMRVQVPINCDVHRPEGFDDTRFGVMTGRRAWLSPEDVLNTRDLAGIRDWLMDRRRRAQTLATPRSAIGEIAETAL